eukprot:gene18166-13808_t
MFRVQNLVPAGSRCYQTVTVTRPADGVAQVSLALPKKRNSLTTEFWAEAKNVFEDLGADGSVRAVVLAGDGPSFCAGIDLGALLSAPPLSAKTDVARKA